MNGSISSARANAPVAVLPLLAAVVAVSVTVVGCCGGSQRPPPPPTGGVALTFDDHGAIESWRNARDFLASYGAKATFFIDYPDNLSSNKLQALSDLVADGHEIGCHGYRHHAAGWFTNRNHPASSFVKYEVAPAIRTMRKRGFAPTSFAYPYGSHTEESNTAVTQLFQVVRTTRKQDAIVPPEGRAVVGAIFIDDVHKPGWPQDYLHLARTSGATVVFCGHSIGGSGEAPAKYTTARATLETICNYATNHGMRFRTLSELAPRGR